MSKVLPKVSIVLPTYNGASKYIRQSIDSCLNQTYKNIELVIVDDGSTDETPQIIRSYKDERIKFIQHEKNMGLPKALNTGFANTTGEYLTWTSDDNQYLPSAIEEMLDYLNRNEDIDLVYADYWICYAETDKRELRRLPDTLDLKERNSVGACFLYTRRVYQEIGDYDPRYKLVEDYDYWIRICKRFNYVHYPRPLYIYTEHSKSLKSTRHHSIVLFDSILKYKNGFISLPRLILSIFYSLPKAKKEAIATYTQNMPRIYQVSIFLGILYSLLPVWFVPLKIMKLSLFALRYSLEYIHFFLSTRRRYFQLRTSKDKKNVLCIVPHLTVSGAERVILNIAKGVDREKFGFHIVTTIPTDNVWHDKFSSYFQSIITPVKRMEIKKLFDKCFRDLVKRLNIDIVLISNSSAGYECLASLKSKFKHIKAIDLLHAEQGLGAQANLDWVIPYIDRRICISEHLKNYMIKKYESLGIGSAYIERLEAIHNGIDMREFSPSALSGGRFRERYGIPEDVRIISFIGRLAPIKNPSLFVEIARQLIAQANDHRLKFVMAGDGVESDKIKSAVSRHRLNDHFLLTGSIDEVGELLADTHVLLVTSISEGIPFVVLEALAMNVPVISTDVGALHEVIKDGVNGYLINPEGNVVESFVAKIMALLSGDSNYNKLSERTRETISGEYSLEAMGMSYQRVFEELLAGL